MQDELLRLQEELQKTIVFITHDLNEALKLGSRIAIMQDGRVVQIGSPEDIVLRPEDQYVGDFTQDVRLESVLTASRVMVAPKATVLGHQGPRAALHTIADSDGDAAWIVDRGQRYIGILTISRAQEALKAGITRLDLGMGYVNQGYETVHPDMSFDELIPMAMGSDYPIPVTDEDNRLVGEVHRSALAEALAETSTAEQDYEANAVANAVLAAEVTNE
jgi:glycine betaine/proline transport system ATP-binding protein